MKKSKLNEVQDEIREFCTKVNKIEGFRVARMNAISPDFMRKYLVDHFDEYEDVIVVLRRRE